MSAAIDLPSYTGSVITPSSRAHNRIASIDFTGEFLETLRQWLRFSRELEPALRRTIGDEAFDQQFADRTDMVLAIEAGLLRRSLLVAAAP